MRHGDPIRTFKARRRVTPGQAEALERLLPAYGVDLSRPFSAREVFGRAAPLVLEVGSGMGETTAAMAAADPGRDLLAVEVHTPGVGALLRRVDSERLRNVRVAEADALDVLRDLLAPGSLDEVRVFFPDPWPKSRHVKRRLLRTPFVDLVADRLRPDGRLHVATDSGSYLAQTLRLLGAHPAFAVVSRARGERPVTRFEQQALDGGRQAHDVVAVRLRTAAG